jgi:hypothetical protein
MYKEEILEVLNGIEDLPHEDARRLAVWIEWNGYDDTPENLPDKVEEYARQEEERFIGEYEDTGKFVEQYYNDTETEETLRILDSVVVDWERTWDYSFRYDFEFDEGYVWRQH